LQPSTLNASANFRAGYADATHGSNGQLRGFVKDPGPLWIKLKIYGAFKNDIILLIQKLQPILGRR